MKYEVSIQEPRVFTDASPLRVHVSCDEPRIMLTATVWPERTESAPDEVVSFTVTQFGNPKERNLDTIIDMIKTADAEIGKLIG